VKGFVDEIIDLGFEGDLDGREIQGIAEAHGLLKKVRMEAPCGEHCTCLEMVGSEEFPIDCYQKTYL
jgi:hypothetical protein